MECIGYIKPEAYLVLGGVGLVALGFIAGGVYSGFRAINDKLTSINDNLTGINKSLRKISEGKLEKGVKQGPKQ